jgi:hypothetical protein
MIPIDFTRLIFFGIGSDGCVVVRDYELALLKPQRCDSCFHVGNCALVRSCDSSAFDVLLDSAICC